MNPTSTHLTADLIEELANDLVPVKVARPGFLLLSWLAVAAVLGVVLSVVLKPRYDFFEQLQSGPFLISSLALMVAFLFASWIAVRGAVPGRLGRGAGVAGWMMIAAFAVYFALYGLLVRGVESEFWAYSGYQTLRCCFLIATATVVAALALLFIVARLAPLDFAVAAIRALFAAFVVGSVVGVVICPFDNVIHRGLGHLLLPIGVATLVYVPLERAFRAFHRAQARQRSSRLLHQ